MAAIEDIEAELNRLKKADLIRIIINKKVPSELTLSDGVVKSIEYCGERESEPKPDDVKERDIASNAKLLSLKCDLKVARTEADLSKKLIRQLEKTVESQELVIHLLRQSNSPGKENCGSVNKPNTVAMTQQPSATVTKEIRNLPKILDREGTNKQPVERSLKHRRQIIWGSNDNTEGNLGGTFAAAAKRVWFHVGKVRRDVKVEDVRNYLHEKFPDQDFIVEELQGHKEATSISFKVGADVGLLDELSNQSAWPKGVAVRKFVFFRQGGRAETHKGVNGEGS